MRFPKKLLFKQDARNALLKGINTVADAVKETLGPKSHNVALNRSSGAPDIIHDGVSIAKEIDLHDEFEDMGAQLIKESSINTNAKAGDGTTTSMIIAQALANKGLEDITAGKNPMTLKTEVEEASNLVVKELKKLSREVKGQEEIEKVATISSADPLIGKLVAEAVEKTGEQGIIRVERGDGLECTVEYKTGMEIDRGYSSQYFVNNGDTVEAIINDPYILITDIKINHNYQIVPFLENVFKTTKNIVIIGEVQEEALATLVVNQVKGRELGVNLLAIAPPAWGGRRQDELEDIAALVGGSVILEESGRDLKSVALEELGRATKIVSDRDKTKILGAMGDPVRLQERIDNIKSQIEVANTQYDKDIKRERLAKLVGGVAIIKSGGVTEVELADKKERIIDAVSAAKASKEEGIVAGGQIALLYISQMDIWPDTLGAKILRESIKAPFRVLMENTGYDYAESLGRVHPVKYPTGINVMTDEVVDMMEAGIFDPTKVVRSALENAISVSTMVFTTNVLISEAYKQNETL